MIFLNKNIFKLNFYMRTWNNLSAAGLKSFPSPCSYNDIEKVDRPKLRVLERTPQYPANLRPPKMQKKLELMRGPEVVHNSLLLKQYGIISTGGGRLRWGHFEMLRLTIGRQMDVNRMFAIWRVPAPWQPITKKGQGQRMGGGKGSIDHYVTPIKIGRVILEVGGACEFEEVEPFLQRVCMQLPFKAKVVSHSMLKNSDILEEKQRQQNVNPFPMKYIIQNNFNGCHRWLSPNDHKWFGNFL